ncbi:uncharacterized protein LOC117107171 [Anneissia japonica]|uniref:uncharacterized protein LOC117107171 n=1 Tax=Anneissia japonica TaxID=1529436 RepID=UPI001425B3D9|nr:uncharacterized protein LOC117107171 [Anneissia japonica]
MVKEMAVLKVCFYFLLIIPLARADMPPCANTETEAVYRGRNRWTLPDPLLAYNNTDMHICSVFCRKNTQCKSFAFADGTCSLYTIQVAKNTRRLVRDESSVHFDSLPIPNRSPGKSYFGACSNGNLCQHGSICENDCTDRGYSCVCAKGFRGINCEHVEVTSAYFKVSTQEKFSCTGHTKTSVVRCSRACVLSASCIAFYDCEECVLITTLENVTNVQFIKYSRLQ